MNDGTIRLSASTSALKDSLCKIAEEMTATKDAFTSSVAAIGAILDASAKLATATNSVMTSLERNGFE